MGEDTTEIVAATRPLVNDWLESLPLESASEFGFLSPNEIQAARLGHPVPAYTPRRRPPLSRDIVEATVEKPSAMWQVPICVGSRIAAVATVMTSEGEPVRALELGNSFVANRLDAGLRFLSGGCGPERLDVRYVTFRSPSVDLLLAPSPGGGWRWLRLQGTVSGEATEMASPEIEALLKELNRAILD